MEQHPALPLKLLALLLSLLLLSAAMAAAEPRVAPEVRTLADAAFVLSDASGPPPLSAEWTPVRLPDFWTRAEGISREGHALGWYRLLLDLSEPPTVAQAIYLPRLSMNAAVHLNGALLGSGGSMTTPVTRNWNRPLLFDAPGPLWRAGENVIHVQLRVSQGGAGVLAPVEVGPVAVLRAKHATRSLIQNQASVAMFVVTLTIGLFMIALWSKLREETAYLLFGLSALAWSVYSLNLFISTIPVSVAVWWTVVHTSIDLWIVLLAMFAHRFTGLRQPRVEMAMLLFVAAGPFLYGDLTPSDSFNRMNVYWQIIPHLIGLYVLLLLIVQWWRTGRRELGGFAFMLVCILALGGRDWYINSGLKPQMWLNSVHLLNFAVPLTFLVLTWHLTRRFVDALHQARTANEDLRARVAEARTELDEAWAVRMRLERERATAEERERLLSDLHDDVGARLVSLIHSSESDASAALARQALADIRSIVSGPEATATDLRAGLDAMESECRERLEAHGMTLNWCVDVHPSELDWLYDDVRHLMRILRECISNVIHHANASQVSLQVQAKGDDLLINIRDDGRGVLAPEPVALSNPTPTGLPQPGRGMRSLQRRAHALGGTIEWCWRNGCLVTVRLPGRGRSERSLYQAPSAR